MEFTKGRRGIRAAPDAVEVQVLQQAVGELLVLLGEDEAPSADPLEALLGPTGEVARPTDPAVARLLPDAYGDDDPEASSEFRRYTESDLRAGKRANATAVLTSLPAPGEPLLLDAEQAAAWLGCLNDLRLVLGVRLEVDEDTDPEELAEDDPRGPALQIYGWLGWLQESLLSCLMPRR